jgi:hypothetical protein
MAYQLYYVGSQTRITPAGTHSGVDITIQNTSTSNIFIGTDQYVAMTWYGHKLEAGKSVAFSVGPNDALWVISDSPTGAEVAVLTLGLTNK